MTVIKKFVSILLAASLCIGSIFSVQGDNAFYAAATPQDDLPSSFIQNLLLQHASDLNYQTCYDLLHSSWSSNYCICFVYYDDNNWNFTVWRSSADSTKPATQWQINTVSDAFSFHPRGYGYLQSKYFYCTTAEGFKSSRAVSWYMHDRQYNPGNIPILTSPCAPNDSNINLTTYKVYFSQNLYYGTNVNEQSSTLAYLYNLVEQWGPPPAPGTQYTDLVYFKLGDTQYLTVDDQTMLHTLKTSETAVLSLSWYVSGEDVEDPPQKFLYWSDLTVIPGGQNQIPGQVSNVYPEGLIALNIDDLGDWEYITLFRIIDDWYGDDFIDWSCSNLPFERPSDPEETQSASEQAWEAFLAYLDTYNHTQIVPGDLASEVFGITGSQCSPAWVAVPNDINGINVVDAPTSISWGFNDLNQSLINWDLMDVCCIAAGSDYYLVEYRLNYGSDPQQVMVDYMDVKAIFDRFDIVIIVDGRIDDEIVDLRYYNAWFGDPPHIPIIFPNEVVSDRFFGWTGQNEYGIDRYNYAVSPYHEDSTYHGFSFLTERGLAKQTLYNFNDGLNNTYELMSDYVFSTEEWRGSFLMWSASMFQMLDSMNGKFDKTKVGSIGWFLDSDIKLSDYLDNILDKLDNLVNNTSVDEVDPGSWFPSLWRFINRFSIQDSTFANWLDDLDDFFDDLPDLPELQPTIIPFPTYIPEPTAGAG